VASAPPVVGTRRERVREQTIDEIKAAARAELVAHGRGGIQLRAVARAVGLTAPALYRYFPGIDELVTAVTVDLYDELNAELEGARDAALAVTNPTDAYQAMLATSRAFRRWAVDHPSEFGLLFATPPTGFAHPPDTPCEEASNRFGTVFAGTFIQMWEENPFPVEPPDAMAPGLVAGLRPYWTWLTDTLAPSMPIGAVVFFLEGWVRIYGIVALEVFGHLSWAVTDGGPMFEETMRVLARDIGRPDAYRPPLD